MRTGKELPPLRTTTSPPGSGKLRPVDSLGSPAVERGGKHLLEKDLSNSKGMVTGTSPVIPGSTMCNVDSQLTVATADSTVPRGESVGKSSTVLERAKAAAAKSAATHKKSESHSTLEKDSAAQKRGSEELTRSARSPSASTRKSMPSSSLSPPAKRLSDTHEAVPEEECESDTDDEDIFARISTAVSKASGTGVSHISVVNGKHASGHKSKSKKSKKSKMNPKNRLVVTFLLLEIAVLGLGLWVAKTIESSVYTVEVSSTAATLNAVQQLYFAKVGRMATGYGQMAVETLFQSYVEKRDPSLEAEVVFRLVAETHSREIEFSTLLDADMKIIASSNTPRQGKSFDPSGVVSSLQANLAYGYTQVSIGAVLSNAELKDELPPQWLERADASSPALFGLHPYDTGRNALIRYVVSAIPSSTNVNQTVGYLLAGDIVNGKMGIPGNVYLSLWGSSSKLVTDGFVGVYFSDDMTRSGWNVCNHAAMATIPGMKSRAMSLDVDVTPRDLLDRAIEANGLPVVTAVKSDAFVFVAQKAPSLSAHIPGDQGDPPVVLVQATNSENWASAFRKSMRLLGIVFAIDVFAIYMASCIFLVPLERLGSRVRAGKQLNLRMVEALKRRKILIVPVLCIPLISFGFSIYCMVWAKGYIHEARVISSVKKTSAVGVEYGSKIDAVRLGFTRLSVNSNIMAVASGQNVTDAILEDVKYQLAYQRDYRQIQYAILVGKDRRILYDPNSEDFVGQVFDPRGLVTQCLVKGNPTVSSVVLTYDEYALEKAPQYDERLYATSPQSYLHPDEAPENDVLVRFAVLPITITDSVGGLVTVGALIAGDVVNGASKITESANELLNQEGYSAIYIVPNSNEEMGDKIEFQLVTSALRENHTTLEVDQEENGVQEMLREVYYDPTAIATKTLDIHGHKHLTTARCSPSDYVFKPEGRLFIERKAGSRCAVIVVQSARGDATNYLAERVSRTSVILLLCQVGKLLVLFYLLGKAFAPFRKIILGGKNDKAKTKLSAVLLAIGRGFRTRGPDLRIHVKL